MGIDISIPYNNSGMERFETTVSSSNYGIINDVPRIEVIKLEELTWDVLKGQVHEWAIQLTLDDDEVWEKVITLMKDHELI